MPKIKALVETARQLIQQAATMREEATKMEDANLRETLLKAANECEEGARSLINGLRGDERKSPVSNLSGFRNRPLGILTFWEDLKSAPVVLELGICADRPHHLDGRVCYSVWSIYDYVMAASLRDYLLTVLREGQQFSLKLDIIGAALLIRADIDERLVAERVQLFFGDGC